MPTAFSYNRLIKWSSSRNTVHFIHVRIFQIFCTMKQVSPVCSTEELAWNPNTTEMNGIYFTNLSRAWISPLDEGITTWYFIWFLTIPSSQMGLHVFLRHSSKPLFLFQCSDRCQPYWKLFKLTPSETLAFCPENKLSSSVCWVHLGMFCRTTPFVLLIGLMYILPVGKHLFYKSVLLDIAGFKLKTLEPHPNIPKVQQCLDQEVGLKSLGRTRPGLRFKLPTLSGTLWDFAIGPALLLSYEHSNLMLFWAVSTYPQWHNTITHQSRELYPWKTEVRLNATLELPLVHPPKEFPNFCLSAHLRQTIQQYP